MDLQKETTQKTVANRITVGLSADWLSLSPIPCCSFRTYHTDLLDFCSIRCWFVFMQLGRLAAWRLWFAHAATTRLSAFLLYSTVPAGWWTFQRKACTAFPLHPWMGSWTTRRSKTKSKVQPSCLPANHAQHWTLSTKSCPAERNTIPLTSVASFQVYM